MKNYLEYDQRNNELPSIIDVPYPYLALGDLREVVRRLTAKNFDGISKQVQREIFEILLEASPRGTTFLTTSMAEVNKKLERKISEEMEVAEGNLGVVILDRYIGEQFGENVFRLNLSRGVNGVLNARPGSDITPDQQVEQMANWAVNGGYSEVLLVDDVLAFGDTLVPLVTLIRELLPVSKIRVLVGVASSGGGWSGMERVIEKTGVEPEALMVVKAGEENEWTSGMALPTSRDFTFLGGKVLTDQETYSQFNFPYFLPFSAPVVSFMPKESRLEVSRKCMKLSIDLVKKINKATGVDLTLGDVADAGFGIPWSNLNCIQELLPTPRRDILLEDYLDYFRYLLEQNAEEILNEVNG